MDESINVPIRPQVDETAVRQTDATLSRLARNRDVEFNATLNAAQFDKNIGRQLGRITGQADEFSKSMNAANARVIAFGASVGIINLVSKSFQGLINSAIEVDEAVRKISISGDETYKNLTQVSKGLFEISKYTTTSFKDAAAAVLEFSRQGKTLAQSLEAAKSALVLTKNTGLDAAEAVRGLTAVVNVFNKEGLGYADVVNKMASVDTKFAVSSKDLIEGINRSASVAQEAQVSFEELTSLITLLQEKTGRGGPVIGNAIKTIFTRVQNPEILKDLKNLGILVTDQSQKFLPATQILINLAKGYEKLDANLQKSVLLKVGGGFQIDKIAAAFSDLKNFGNGSRFESIFDVANSNNTTAAFKKAEEQSKSFQGRLTKLSIVGQQLGDTIGEIGFRDDLMQKTSAFSSFLEKLNKNISGGEGEKSGATLGKAVVKGLGAAATGPGAFIFATLFAKSALDLVKFAASALQSFTGVTTKNKEQQSIQESIFNTLIRNEKAQQAIFDIEGGRVEQAKALAAEYAKTADQIERVSKLSKELSPMVYQMGIRTGSGQLTNVGKPPPSTAQAPKANATSFAKGYVPNFTSESQAYQNEVANAPAGAKIIRHTNFPLGGGKKAPVMFTNDKETLIPNFAGTGGTAVIPRYRTSANGFIPNFAEETNAKGPIKDVFNVDAMSFGIGGLSLGTDIGNKTQRYQGGLIGKAKAKELYKDGRETNYLKKLKKSPLYEALKDYSKVQVSNVPVGAVYSFAKGISDNEEVIKKQFIGRANNQISGSIATFILSELKNLGLKIPSQFENALKSNPQSFNLIDDSSAGGFFEKIVQYASLNGRPVESLKANEKTPFDIYGLAAKDAESFGLPSKNFRYVEVKSSIQELYDGITEKFVRQSQIETAAPKAGSAAGGYIPNFAEDALSKSISREVKATGLPLSKIKVSKDPRLFSASKNPLGLGVTNAKDEPRGMSDVSSGRIREAYASSVFGYIPNFARLTKEQQAKLDAEFLKEMGGDLPKKRGRPSRSKVEPEPVKNASETAQTEIPPAAKSTGRGGVRKGAGRKKGSLNKTDVSSTPKASDLLVNIAAETRSAEALTTALGEAVIAVEAQLAETDTFSKTGFAQGSYNESDAAKISLENKKQNEALEYVKSQLTEQERSSRLNFLENERLRPDEVDELSKKDKASYEKKLAEYNKIESKVQTLAGQYSQSQTSSAPIESVSGIQAAMGTGPIQIPTSGSSPASIKIQAVANVAQNQTPAKARNRRTRSVAPAAPAATPATAPMPEILPTQIAASASGGGSGGRGGNATAAAASPEPEPEPQKNATGLNPISSAQAQAFEANRRKRLKELADKEASRVNAKDARRRVRNAVGLQPLSQDQAIASKVAKRQALDQLAQQARERRVNENAQSTITNFNAISDKFLPQNWQQSQIQGGKLLNSILGSEQSFGSFYNATKYPGLSREEIIQKQAMERRSADLAKLNAQTAPSGPSDVQKFLDESLAPKATMQGANRRYEGANDILTQKEISERIKRKAREAKLRAAQNSKRLYSNLGSIYQSQPQSFTLRDKVPAQTSASYESLPASALADLASGRITQEQLDKMRAESLPANAIPTTSLNSYTYSGASPVAAQVSNFGIPQTRRSTAAAAPQYTQGFRGRTGLFGGIIAEPIPPVPPAPVRRPPYTRTDLELNTSLLTGQGARGGQTVLGGLDKDQINKLKSAVAQLITQFQESGKPFGSLNSMAEKLARDLRQYGINFKPENLREIAVGTAQAERQRTILAASIPQSASIGTPAPVPESSLTRFRLPNRFDVRDVRDRLTSRYLSFGESVERGYNAARTGIPNAIEGGYNAVRTGITNAGSRVRDFGVGVATQARSLIGTFAGQSDEEKKRKEIDKQINKSSAESAAALARMYTITASVTGALSVFGERIANASQAIASLINSLVVYREGKNIAAELRGKTSVTDAAGNVIGERSLSFRELRRQATRSGIQAMRGTDGTPGTGLLGNLQYAGGYMAGGGTKILASSIATAAVTGAVLIEAMNALDSIWKVFTKDVGKSSDELATLSDLQKKYALTLSETSRSLLSSMSSLGEVQSSGFKGFLARQGLVTNFDLNSSGRNFQSNLAKLNFSDKANPEFFNLLNETSLAQAENELRASTGKTTLDPKEVRKRAQQLNKLFVDSLILDPYAKRENPFAVTESPTQSRAAQAPNANLIKSLKPDEQESARQIALIRLSERRRNLEKTNYQRMALQQGELGVSKEYLMNQLSLSTKIADAANNLTTAEEYRLQINKENFSISEKQKDLDELRLKLIQNERQVRQDINSAVSSTITQELTTKLGPSPFGVTTEDFKKYTSAFKSVTVDLNPNLKGQDLENELKNRVTKIYTDTLGVGVASPNDEVRNRIINQSAGILLETINANLKIGDAKANQLRLDYDSLRAIKARKYVEDSLRENLDSRLTIQQKSLSLLREERDLRLNIKENQLKTSLNANYNITPRRADLILTEAAPEQQKARAESALRARRDESFSSLRKSVIDYTVKNNPKILEDSKAIDKLINTKSEGDLLKALEDAMAFQADQFDPLKNAADHFTESTDSALKRLVDGMLDSMGIKTEKNKIPYLLERPPEATKNNLSSTPLTPEVDAAQVALQEQEKALVDAALKARIKNRSKLQLEGFKNPIASNAQEDIDTAYVEQKTAAGRKVKLSKDFEGGLMGSRIQMNEDIEFFANKMGREIPDSFRDSMVSAMRELANPNSTEPLKNRLLGVANAFLQKINESLMTNLANKITSPITGLFTPEMKASGGMITGGSGSKDDVPAMLMGGEYVVKKSAVKKYGPSFLDALNSGKIQKFAQGGWVESDITKYQDPASVNPYGQRRDQGLSFNESGQVIGMDSYTGTAENKQDAMMRAQSDYYAKNAQTGQGGFYMPGENGMGAIMGQRNLLSFATQQTAGTRFDRISGIGGMGSVDLGAGSSNMSLFALRDQENSRNAAYLESKQKSLDLYLSGIDATKEKAVREEEIRKEQERIREEAKKQEKAMVRGILTSLASSALMAGISYAGNTMSQGMISAKQAAWQENRQAGFMEGALSGGTINGENRGGLFNTFNSKGTQNFSNMVDTQGNFYQWDKKSKTYFNQGSDTYNKAFPTGGNYGSSANNNGYYFPTRRAAGGYVAGNGMGDNVPTMLNGGEFVISKQATQNIGTNKLQQLNSGTSSDSSEMIATKLDELVEKLSAVGTLNITVNSDSSGKQQSQEQGGNQDKEAKELARRIKEVVMVVLKDERRLGGMLR
jgi:TP901 family phage tail tape measure protein